MPSYCPRCAKKFKDSSLVQNHMNQPISSCRTYYEEVLQVNEALFGATNDNLPDSHSTSSFTPGDSLDGQHLHSMDVDYVAPDAPNIPENSPSQSSTPIFPYFKQVHPSASKICGKGNTFMDNFENDQYADRRIGQLYYPFASKHEWELAAFLLRSNLSMVSIDKFLKLKLVHASLIFLIMCHANCHVGCCRFPIFTFLFGRQKNFEIGQNYFLQVLGGPASR